MEIPGLEILGKRTVSTNSLSKLPETMRKLCVSSKFPHQEIRWNYGILRSELFCTNYHILEFEHYKRALKARNISKYILFAIFDLIRVKWLFLLLYIQLLFRELNVAQVFADNILNCIHMMSINHAWINSVISLSLLPKWYILFLVQNLESLASSNLSDYLSTL